MTPQTSEQRVSRSPFQKTPPNDKQVQACSRKKRYTYAVACMRCNDKHPACKSKTLNPYHCPVCGWWHLTSQR
jgi:hypothetical protein